MSWDVRNTARLRDIIRRMTQKELDQQRPAARYGNCTAVNRTTRTATITWPDGTVQDVKMGSIQPASVPMQVRVEGTPGNYYIADVAGPVLAMGETGWTAPTLLNSWTNVGGAYETAGYRKTGAGLVIVKGLVTGGVATAVFTLPVGYRPAARLAFATTANNAFGRVDVQADGSVIHLTGTATNVSLAPVMFYADA